MHASVRAENRRLLSKLAVIAVGMFAFGYALVPFYEQICKVTGINNLLKPDVAVNTQVDSARWITVEFDANLRGDLPWRFKPEQTRIKLHPGQMANVVYDVENTSGRTIVGQAVPSYGPSVAAQYFKKLECFCFTQQTFKPGEKRRMPVSFVVDAGLPNEVEVITLSYSFFEVAGTAKPGA
ncbi:cytochrome c oxidase assembly protein [Chitinimonas arctica]|uniref:Cytochrome c oxidase assembly protein CtaG n=1 Tax=Chitinimonas arctica TaxID=2594795 RepID=A0A516SH71_9NEIS|nr:cytochrome c oxidase assembly protein [Chitinimonas arctica]QDQ27482.1 cytochrome c oxidase assembly protein [Chitinimonas arctica]